VVNARNVVRAVALLAILAGIGLRFTGLDRKIYSFDEATTSIRVAGYTLSEYGQEAFGGVVIDNRTFSAYQRVDGRHSVGDMIYSLAAEDPQHPPLYYLAERLVSQTFGNSVAARRVVSAIAGTLLLAAAGWLCFELFGSFDAAIALAALLAVSPFFVIYSQQAREYAVWGFWTAVASAFLLRALRRDRAADWLGYAVSAALGLYTDLIFLYVLAGHALYVAVVLAREGRLRRGIGYVVASAAALAAYGPWLATVYRGRDLLTNNSYLATPLPAKIMALKWIFNIGAVFFDLDYRKTVLAVVLLPIFLLLAVALGELLRSAPLRAWAFVLTLAGVTTAAFLLPDILFHESRSTAPRYLVPTWIALETVVAGWIGWRLAATSARQHLIGASVFVGLVVCGLASTAVDARDVSTWAEGKSIAGLAPIADIVNGASRPLLVFVDDPERFDFALLAISNELGPGVRVQQLSYGSGVTIGRNDGSEVYLLDPTPRVRAALDRAGARLHAVYADSDTSDAQIRKLRAETSRLRGGEDNVLSLWRIDAGAGGVAAR
jgi:uncharacterized membrane protein